jgi:hypothetical protein
VLWVLARDLPPQRQQRHAHDHIAGDHHADVERVAVLNRREHLSQPERKHDHSDQLDVAHGRLDRRVAHPSLDGRDLGATNRECSERVAQVVEAQLSGSAAL